MVTGDCSRAKKWWLSFWFPFQAIKTGTLNKKTSHPNGLVLQGLAPKPGFPAGASGTVKPMPASERLRAADWDRSEPKRGSGGGLQLTNQISARRCVAFQVEKRAVVVAAAAVLVVVAKPCSFTRKCETARGNSQVGVAACTHLILFAVIKPVPKRLPSAQTAHVLFHTHFREKQKHVRARPVWSFDGGRKKKPENLA